MIHIAFDAPLPHVRQFRPLSDFTVARDKPAMLDVTYREALKPIGLLIAEVMPIGELRRRNTLLHPEHITIGPLDGDRREREIQLRDIQVVIDSEIALVVPVDDIDGAQLALAEDVSVIVPDAGLNVVDPHETCLRWCLEIQHNTSDKLWFHFRNVDPTALRLLVESDLKHLSIDTRWPFHQALGDHATDDTRLDPDQLREAYELAEAMKAAVA